MTDQLNLQDFPFKWVISDTHFSHVNILKFEADKRPFHSIDQMNGELIRRWNRVVAPEDPILHLGDLSLGVLESSLPLTTALNGRRYLVPGNHDRISSVFNGGKNRERFLPMYEDAGWTILPEVFRARLAGRGVQVSHFPYAGDSRSDRPDRHVDARPVDDGSPLIHGHVHSEFATRGRMFNVGVDVHNLAPTPVSEIVDWLGRLA